MIKSVRERLASRFSTIRQLRTDNTKQLQAIISSELKSIPPTQGVEAKDRDRGDRLDVLNATVRQLANKLDVECITFRRELTDNFAPMQERRIALFHVVERQEGSQRGSLSSMQSMIEQFALQTKKQLADLRYEREQFEDHFTARITKLGETDPRSL